MPISATQRKLLARLVILALLFGVVWFVRHRQQTASQLPAPTVPSGQQTTPIPSGTPAHVLQILEYIRRNGQAPEDYVGGKEFINREKRLPAKAADGKRIRYSEWDVHPKVKGQNRGPERLVTGSDHSAWYTKDHYKSFVKIE